MSEKRDEDVVDQAPERQSEDHNNAKLSNAFVQDAKNASDKEQKMTLLEGVRLYPKAIAWSMLISTCIVMEG